jgi:AraC-like DNA-binding protein
VYDLENKIQALYPQGAVADDIRSVLEAIRDEYDAEQYGTHDMIRSYLFILLVKASRMVEPGSSAYAGHRSLLLHRRFQALLEEQFVDLQQPAEYARLLRCTERALNDATRRCAGSTVAQLIRERVILEAKRLLAHSGVQVAQVAAQLGFEDPAYFSRCFKKHTGRTPVEFRQSVPRMTE